MTRSRLAVLSLSLLTACGGELTDEQLGTRQDELLLPAAAVAMGDSFISGEAADDGGVDYLGAVTVPGTSYVIPASNVPGNYCHRSRKASIFLAALPGISARFNLACSGAESKDIASANTQYSEPAQLDHLAAVARSHDVKLIVLSLGGNDLGFADYLISCMKKFALDAANPFGGTGCTPSDLPDDTKFQDMKTKVSAAIDRIRATMRAAGKTDTSYRLIVQSYPSPLPGRYADNFHRERFIGIWQYDTNWVFPNLAGTRFGYPGCPFHEETGASFIAASRKATDLLKQVASSRGAEFLALHDALNGYGRCERTNPDESAITGMLHADNSVWQNMLRTGTSGTKPFNIFQESMHPNLRGHQMLGACLGAAYASTTSSKQCLPGGAVTAY